MIYSVKWSSEKSLTATFIVYYSIQWEILTCQLTCILCKGSKMCSSEFYIGVTYVSKHSFGLRIFQYSLWSDYVIIV